ncbi:L,D-transpeptidase scaffold domain-containing protein [Hymenobacter telluris]|uniref:L,D-transpeptidase family protein n=1 Tax=Hymenobacter telluris TaxID=2816474 RepID=UPI001A8E8FD5|nr:L,D-transpeptidase family protein [Hymenobacter telluris]
MLLWLAVTGGVLSLGSAQAHAGPPQPKPAPVAALSLRTALDTVALGSAATYTQLGLQAGPAVQQFYSQRDFTPAWTHADSAGWNHNARQALALLRCAPEYGLDPATYSWSILSALPDSLHYLAAKTATLAGYELRLTDALLRFATHLRYGRLHPLTLTPIVLTQPQTQEAVDGLRQALASPELTTAFLSCQPTSRAYCQLQQAWSATLRQHPDSLHPTTGNAADFRRVALNLERLRWDLQRPDSGDYALVNIAAYQLQLIRNGQVVQSHRIVVGKPDTPTPTLDSRITVFVTAPEWRVPYSIAVNEMLPELQNDPGFLADNNYFLLDYRGRRVNPWRVNWQRITPQTFPYTIRQTAGRHNALGNIVFYFTNQHGIYVHDTPARALFREPKRARSHGCIRIEKPLELAAFLLKREGQQAALPDIRRSIATHDRCRYDLAGGLPIRIRYYTCEAQNNHIRYYADVYCQDEAVAAAFFKP